jgi:UDP-glucose-4-epimerase GalE
MKAGDVSQGFPHMRILVTGGAGYIGSHTVLRLAELGHHSVVVDDLSNGHADAVLHGSFERFDIRDTVRLTALLRDERIDGVIHFAAFIEAGLSMIEPLRFWNNNVGGTLSVLTAMRDAGVVRLVFSSTAALYGNPQRQPIDEDDPLLPTNSYGDTKLAAERLIAAADRAHGIGSVCLRYFNAAGADPAGRIGERHDPESHLIPLALAAAAGSGKGLTLFGTDYPTADGTCIRDYIHVADLADAHVRAMDHLAGGGPSRCFNLGCGRGWSVRQVIDAVEAVTGRTVPVTIGPRRAGDPVALVAANRRALAELAWQPRWPDLHDMVAHAWAFMNR